jgi:small subunit ribosomal protein S20
VANIKSAKKRILVNEKKSVINKQRKSEIKTYIKKFEASVEENNKEEAKELLILLQKKLSKASAKSTMHSKAASRKIGRLTKKFNSIA